jgi:multidrug efflux pump subunit AcrA (membrane-fusion protein)
MGRNGLLGLLGRNSKGSSEDGMSTIPGAVHKARIATITDKVAILRQEAEAIAVINQDDYTKALTFVKGLRAYKKDVGFKLDPGIHSAREHLEFLREEKAKHIRPIDEIDKAVSARAGAWREKERLAAAAEEKRLNEERRRAAAEEAEAARRAAEATAEIQRKQRQKEIEAARKRGEIRQREANRLAKEAAEQAEREKQYAREDEEAARLVKDVKVKPAIPKLAGTMGRTNWHWRWNEDGENELLDGFRENMSLRPFVQANEQQIGQMVRAKKDKKKAETECPGIEVWSKDAV